MLDGTSIAVKWFFSFLNLQIDVCFSDKCQVDFSNAHDGSV